MVVSVCRCEKRGVTSPATGSEPHASGTSYNTRASKQTQEDVRKELHHHSSFVRGVLSGRFEWEEEECWELGACNDIYAKASLVTHTT